MGGQQVNLFFGKWFYLILAFGLDATNHLLQLFGAEASQRYVEVVGVEFQ